jgi:hypothetical protein
MLLHVMTTALRLSLPVAFVLACLAAPASAQSQFPPPADPVTICGTQAAPNATSYQLVFDGGAPEAVTLVAPSAVCPSGSTHSFTLAAARFTVGPHTLQLRATNAFGTTVGPVHNVSVGIAPGQFTVTAVVSGN